VRDNMKKVSSENNLEAPEEAEALEGSAVSGDGREGQDKAKENTAKLLMASLKSASEGIAKGVQGDLASEKAAGSIFGDIAELIAAPLLLSMPGRALERGIKGAKKVDGFISANDKVNLEAKNRLQQRIISPSLQLYASNFAPLISVLNKIPYIKNLEPNDITNIEAMAIEFKGRSVSTINFGQESPYKIILKQIIPMFREKFDAVASFDKTLGPGARIDHEGLSQDLLDGMEIEEDIAELERFYKAISEWRAVLVAFQEQTDNTRGADSSAEGKKKVDSDGEEESGEEGASSKGTAIADNIHIHAVRPGQYVHRDPTGEDGLYINNYAVNSEDTPVIKLYIKGGGADGVNSSGSGEAYLKHFIDKGMVVFPEGVRLSQIVYNVTRESVAGGSEITIYFRPDGVRSIKGQSTERAEIMRVSTRRGTIPVFIDDTSQVKALERAASSATTPYYQAVSPSGETISFTPSDLVISGGKLRDSKGKQFRPKKIKGKSLAERVTSKGYGKVRGRS
jgi:hypothetical protein